MPNPSPNPSPNPPLAAALNLTHDPQARSWLRAANDHTDFPLQNLPFGRFRRMGSLDEFRCGVAIGDQVLDLCALASYPRWLQAPGVNGPKAGAAVQAAAGDLRALMRMGPQAWHALRVALFLALRSDAANEVQQELTACLVDQRAAELTTAVPVGEYTDFYTSLHHARNVGRAVGNGGLVSPNFFWMPIAYHGRASSMGVQQRLHRPMGQMMASDAQAPNYGACQRLDFELEMALYVGQDNPMGRAVPMERAEQHIFGMGLLNDWSARDIQFWEMAPLGPFLGKNFATSLSPWIVTLEALAPFRLPFTRDAEHPAPLAYLDSAALRAQGALDIHLAVGLQTQAMREQSLAQEDIARTNFRHQHWCIAQMLAQHTVGGCNLRAGDVLGTGTVSGPEPSEAGAMIELTQAGRAPLTLANGEQRSFLHDGDRVVLRGWCEREGAVRIGFGTCEGEILPALQAT